MIPARGRPAAPASPPNETMSKRPSTTAVFLTSAAAPDGFPPPEVPEVCFVGRSNVGKSSLLNRLAGKRAVAAVSRTPGRTRLVNFFQVGDRYRLVDLPGYGFARVPDAVRAPWERLVLAYLAGRETLALHLLLVDIRREPLESDRAALDLLLEGEAPVVVVATKADKLKHGARAAQLRLLEAAYRSAGAAAVVPCSAVTFGKRKAKGPTGGARRSGVEAVRRVVEERVAAWR